MRCAPCVLPLTLGGRITRRRAQNVTNQTPGVGFPACLSMGGVTGPGRNKTRRNPPLIAWRSRYRTYLLEEAAMYGNGLWGLLVLIADVWAIVNIVQSAADTGKKVLWIVLVVVLPLLGVILWYFLGPRTGKS